MDFFHEIPMILTDFFATRIRIIDTDPGDQNDAYPTGSGSTLLVNIMPSGSGLQKISQNQPGIRFNFPDIRQIEILMVLNS